MKVTITLLLLLIPFFSSAAVVSCATNDVKRILVQADREGSHGHENKLIIQLSNNGVDILCAGNTYVYIENTSPAYTGVLSVLLAAQASARQVEIFVNTTVIAGGNAAQIAWVSLSKE